jgi:hypothetical protein
VRKVFGGKWKLRQLETGGNKCIHVYMIICGINSMWTAMLTLSFLFLASAHDSMMNSRLVHMMQHSRIEVDLILVGCRRCAVAITSTWDEAFFDSG